MTPKCLASKITNKNDHLITLSDEKSGTGFVKNKGQSPGGGLPYMGYIGMCRCEGYGFQAVYSRTGYIN